MADFSREVSMVVCAVVSDLLNDVLPFLNYV